jgi:L-rhamnose isomerase/sugar isomerase
LVAEARLRAGGALNPIQLFRQAEIRNKLIMQRGSARKATGL